MDTDSLPRCVCLPGPKYRNTRAWSADTCFLALCFNLRKPLLSWCMQISCRTDEEHIGKVQLWVVTDFTDTELACPGPIAACVEMFVDQGLPRGDRYQQHHGSPETKHVTSTTEQGGGNTHRPPWVSAEQRFLAHEQLRSVLAEVSHKYHLVVLTSNSQGNWRSQLQKPCFYIICH